MTRKEQALIEKTNHQKIKLGFFVLASAVTFYLAWQVFLPYMMLTATAVVAALTLAPFHLWLCQKTRHHLRWCAFLTTVLAMLVSGLPLAIGVILLIQQLNNWQTIDRAALMSSQLWQFFPKDLQAFVLQLDVDIVLTRVTQFLSENVAVILSSTSQVLLMTFLFFVILYYLLAEREVVYQKVLALSPLSNRIDNALIKRLTSTVRAVVLGNVVVGGLQGVLAGLGFLVFGVPNAFLWGVVTLLAAQIPMVGTAVITAPAALYLLFTGHASAAIGLGIWGMLLVGGIDNVLKPKLVEGRTNMHPLLILLSMFGGLQFFGPVGFILGPAVLAAALSFLEMYETGVLAGTVEL